MRHWPRRYGEKLRLGQLGEWTAHWPHTTMIPVELLITSFPISSLYMTYTGMSASGGDKVACEAIIASIEKQWENSDQEPFIVAVLLNFLLKTLVIWFYLRVPWREGIILIYRGYYPWGKESTTLEATWRIATLETGGWTRKERQHFVRFRKGEGN